MPSTPVLAYPSLKIRYFSLLLDTLLIAMISVGISNLLDNLQQVPDYVRGILFVVVFFLYEPILISTACTFGQLVTNIRVRRLDNPVRKIGFTAALFRFIIKGLLSWLSFITVTFNENHRAIHDYACGSVMIDNPNAGKLSAS